MISVESKLIFGNLFQSRPVNIGCSLAGADTALGEATLWPGTLVSGVGLDARRVQDSVRARSFREGFFFIVGGVSPT